MKKILFILTIFASTYAKAQDSTYFKLFPTGFESINSAHPQFAVVDIPGKTQSELYKKTLIILSSIYVSPKEALSTIDNESITVNGVEKNAIYIKGFLGAGTTYSVNYTINFQFKDGKIRIDRPSVNRLHSNLSSNTTVIILSNSNPERSANNREAFSKDGKVKIESAVKNTEAYFNHYISNIVSKLKNSSTEW